MAQGSGGAWCRVRAGVWAGVRRQVRGAGGPWVLPGCWGVEARRRRLLLMLLARQGAGADRQGRQGHTAQVTTEQANGCKGWDSGHGAGLGRVGRDKRVSWGVGASHRRAGQSAHSERHHRISRAGQARSGRLSRGREHSASQQYVEIRWVGNCMTGVALSRLGSSPTGRISLFLASGRHTYCLCSVSPSRPSCAQMELGVVRTNRNGRIGCDGG